MLRSIRSAVGAVVVLVGGAALAQPPAGTPDYRDFWTEAVHAPGEELILTWHDIGDPLLIHTQPNAQPDRPYGVCTVLVPALSTRLTLNGQQAAGQSWPRQREGRPFSTSALAFSESWTATRSSAAAVQ